MVCSPVFSNLLFDMFALSCFSGISVTMKYCCSTSLKYYVTHHGLMMMRGITYDVMTVILMT